MMVFVRLTTNIATVEYVLLMAVLVFFCVRTRSKGLICIAVSLIGIKSLGWLVPAVYNTIWGERWESGLDVRGVSLLRNLEVAIVSSGIVVVLSHGLCLFGAFLIYKEWRDGKFNCPPPEIKHIKFWCGDLSVSSSISVIGFVIASLAWDLVSIEKLNFLITYIGTLMVLYGAWSAKRAVDKKPNVVSMKQVLIVGAVCVSPLIVCAIL